jgi:hypothetical protein
MNLIDLKRKADQIQAAFTQTEQSRKLWREEKKQLLITVLGQIAQASGLKLEVQNLDWITNSEGVNLLFSVYPSGMVEKYENGFRSYIKHGGYIVFAQAYNGDIFVLINYPWIEEKVTRAETKTLGKFNPKEITEAFIYEKVGLFFDEMLMWETDSSSRTSIGFATSREAKRDPS